MKAVYNKIRSGGNIDEIMADLTTITAVATTKFTEIKALMENIDMKDVEEKMKAGMLDGLVAAINEAGKNLGE